MLIICKGLCKTGQVVVSALIRVNVENQDYFEATLKRFSKTCQREGILSEIKRREFFEKPCATRRRESRERLRNMRRIERLRGLSRPRRKR